VPEGRRGSEVSTVPSGAPSPGGRNQKSVIRNLIHTFVINLAEQKLNLLIKIYQMQFLLVAYDGTDPGAMERRMKVREEHLEKAGLLKRSGEMLFGGAILDDDGRMIGSMILYEFPDRKSLDERLKDEPYINNGVWEKYEIRPFRLAKT
jgi:hypothetical protein